MRLTPCAAALALALAATTAAATPRYHDFSITWQSGPLAAQTTAGRLAYDSTLVWPGAEYFAVSLLSDFMLEPTPGQALLLPVDTGWLRFGSDGALTGLAFGSNCNPSCSANSSVAGEWWFNWSLSGPRMAMASVGDGVGFSTSEALNVMAVVPEPGTWLMGLLGLPLVALVAVSRRRRGRRPQSL
jgi:hypothetical protein